MWATQPTRYNWIMHVGMIWIWVTRREGRKLWGCRKKREFHFLAEKLTRKKASVLPPLSAPYLIFVCFDKSSALSMGESIRSTVRKAARLAVYDDIMIKVKNHQIPATTLLCSCCAILHRKTQMKTAEEEKEKRQKQRIHEKIMWTE